MSQPKLPVETWCDILDRCILVPSFLDPDYLVELVDPLHIAFDGDREYWKSEKQRNLLRRVCKSWDTYLRLIGHRYIRLDDIRHERIPEAAIRKAKRLNYRTCSRGINCDRCYPVDPSTYRPLAPLLQTIGETDLEIIEAEHESGALIPSVILHAFAQLPRLKVILRAQRRTPIGTGWITTLNSFPSLQFLRLDDHIGDSYWPVFQAPNLTTLSFSNLSAPFSLPLHDCSLPSLRHLRFRQLPTSPHDLLQQMPNLMRILEVIGQNLLSLQLGCNVIREVKIPPKLWTMCPRLQRLDTSLGFASDPTQLPPTDNILRVLSFPLNYYDIYVDNGAIALSVAPPTDPRFPPSIITRFPKLKRLIVARPWVDMESIIQSSDEQMVNPWMVKLIKACREHDVRLEDIYNNLFEDSRLVRFLRTEEFQ